MKPLLKTGKVNAGSMDSYSRTLLSRAAGNRHGAVVRLLKSSIAM